MGIFESGTPVSEFGGSPVGAPYFQFVGARGSHGRTPTLWDLNLRLSYEPVFVARGILKPRFTVDAFHIGSQRKAVRYDEVHYRTLDTSGSQADANPTWGQPTAYQPPAAVRLGMEMGF